MQRRNDDDGRKLFVASLPYDTTEAVLRNFFEAKGGVMNCHIAKDRETGESRGFAFVTYETVDQAEAALDLDQTELEGRAIKVALAGQGGQGARKRDGGTVEGHDREVDITAYKAERISEQQQRVVLRQSKLPAEMQTHAEDFVFSDDEVVASEATDPERSFVDSLSSKEKRRLLRSLGNTDVEGGSGGRDKKKKKKKKEKRKKKKEKKSRNKHKRKSSSTSGSSSSSDDSGSDTEHGPKRSRI